MAWISIHEQVTGSKLRKFAKKAGCTQNEALGLIVRMWLWCIKNIDQDGLLKSMDRYDLAEVINIGLGKTYDPEKIVDAMVSTGWVDEEDGQLFIHEWGEWQRYYYNYMSKNKNEAERKRKSRAAKRHEESQEAEVEKQESDEPEQEDCASNAESIESVKISKQTAEYTEDFEAFWNAYPRKKEKRDTFEKYKARLNEGFDEATLLSAAVAYRDECIRNQTQQKYIKLGKTFLSNKLPFTDYVSGKSQMMAPKAGTTSTSATYEDPFGDWR